MPFSYAQYAGNGSTTTFSVPFPYLLKAHVKLYTGFNILTGAYTSLLVDGADYTWTSTTQVQTTVAPANGVTLTVIRDTPDSTQLVPWQDGSNLVADDMNIADLQNLYVVQEQQDRNDAGITQSTAAAAAATAATTAANTATSTANTALSTANAATSTANTALSTANTASSNASAAVSTANTASSNASAAVTTANAANATAGTASTNASNAVTTANTAAANAATALSTANTAATNASAAVSTANTASSNAAAAVSTANTANTNASNAVTTANTASTNASAAVSTANAASTAATSATTTANTANNKADQAIAAVSNSVNYQLKANVAAIPASPANDTYIEVQDSTGLESFTPLAGKPAGFVGDAGLKARLRYTSSGSTWNWIDYAPSDSDARYLKKTGGTMTGKITLDGAPIAPLHPATKGYVDGNVSALQGDIGTVSTAAAAAQSTANTAVSNAATAQSTANTAVSNAAAAQTTANAALPKAGGTMSGSITFAGGQTFPTSGISAATTSSSGIVQLSDSTSAASSSTAATSAAVKAVQDFAQVVSATANAAMPKAGGVFSGPVTIPFAQAGTGAVTRTVDSRLKDFVSVKDFGARGDGLGTTPADEGVDISNAAWNTWDGTPFKTDLSWSPYGTGGVFNPPTAKPFQNTDTWDFIGVQLALWYGAKSVYLPRGTYVINVSRAGGGLVIMKGQEQSIFGAGAYRSVFVPKENAAFFGANNVNSANAYWLLRLYRVGGPPTHLADLEFSGPNGYGQNSNNLTLLHCENINGVTLRDLWISAAHIGITGVTSSGDSHIKGITFEYLFGASVFTDSSSDFSIDFCNIWASAANVQTQKGVVAQGRCSITNSRLVGFYGNAVEMGNGTFSNNLVTLSGTARAVFSGSAVVSNNMFSGGTSDLLVSVGPSSTVTGNWFKQTGNHPCLNLGSDAVGSATNINVTGNTFIKTDNAVQAQNFAIIGIVNGVGYTQALSQSCLIVGNTFQGRAMTAPGSATMVKNTFDGVLQSAVNAEATTNNGAVTNNAAVTNNSTVTNLSDVVGKQLMTGSVASGTTVNITGMLGQGSGGGRDKARLNLIAVIAGGNSFDGRAYALFSSKWNGNATLFATLGHQSDGGSIAFGTSGTNPTFTATAGAGGTVGYEVIAIPLI